MAARSDSAPASARQPTSCGDVRPPRRKCVPSTITSTDVTATPAPAVRTTAQSSPSQRTTREPAGRRSTAPMASMRASSPSASAVAVHDPRAVEVVGGDLHADPVARQDPDAEAAHLARDVAEDLVSVVELDAEHGVGEGLHHLALELDLLLLRHLGREDGRPAHAAGNVCDGLVAVALGRRLVQRGVVGVAARAAAAAAGPAAGPATGPA